MVEPDALSGDLIKKGGLPLYWKAWMSCVRISETGSSVSSQEMTPLLLGCDASVKEVIDWPGGKIGIWQEKAEREMGWKAKTGIREGFELFGEWFQKNHSVWEMYRKMITR